MDHTSRHRRRLVRHLGHFPRGDQPWRRLRLRADFTQEQAKDIWVRKGCHGYVVAQGDEIVGTFTLRTNQPGFGNHIANAGYMVHRDHRGRGIAQAMCGYSLKEAKKMGYEAMQFNLVVASNEPTVKLSQKMGFKIVGTVPRAFRHASLGPTDVHIMHRFLDEIKTSE